MNIVTQLLLSLYLTDLSFSVRVTACSSGAVGRKKTSLKDYYYLNNNDKKKYINEGPHSKDEVVVVFGASSALNPQRNSRAGDCAQYVLSPVQTYDGRKRRAFSW